MVQASECERIEFMVIHCDMGRRHALKAKANTGHDETKNDACDFAQGV